MSEHDYLSEQHLLLAIKSVDNDESYGKKSLWTHSYFDRLCRRNKAFSMTLSENWVPKQRLAVSSVRSRFWRLKKPENLEKTF